MSQGQFSEFIHFHVNCFFFKQLTYGIKNVIYNQRSIIIQFIMDQKRSPSMESGLERRRKFESRSAKSFEEELAQSLHAK